MLFRRLFVLFSFCRVTLLYRNRFGEGAAWALNRVKRAKEMACERRILLDIGPCTNCTHAPHAEVRVWSRWLTKRPGRFPVFFCDFSVRQKAETFVSFYIFCFFFLRKTKESVSGTLRVFLVCDRYPCVGLLLCCVYACRRTLCACIRGNVRLGFSQQQSASLYAGVRPYCGSFLVDFCVFARCLFILCAERVRVVGLFFFSLYIWVVV